MCAEVSFPLPVTLSQIARLLFKMRKESIPLGEIFTRLPLVAVPTLIISPYAKRGFVDHTEYDTTSILKFIETRFGLKALGERDANANNLNNAFEFNVQN
jgi:hypothetical protein